MTAAFLGKERTEDTRWNSYKVQLKKRWNNLTDYEIDHYRGSFNHLAKAIEIKCSESHEVVQDFIDRLWFEIYLRR